MRLFILFMFFITLSACSLLPYHEQIKPVITTSEQVQEPIEPQVITAPEEAPLAINDDAKSLQAWIHYRAKVLENINDARNELQNEGHRDDVWHLKRAMLQLHPETPYATRLRNPILPAESLAERSSVLAALLSWDLLYHQKLLEAGSAISALTQLNAQQLNQIERLQKTNLELQKKIDALTQIEAQLTQPVTINEDDNGQLYP